MHFLNPNSGLIRVGFASPAKRIGRSAIGSGVFLFLFLFSAQAQISSANWGKITAPVYGTSETVAGGAYSNAELFAGPNKFGNYFSGVLPNGRKVTPTGTTIQIGMNPLGIALTPDGKYLITSNDDEREGGFASYQSTANLGGYSLSVIDTTAMSVVSQINISGKFFVGLQATGTGPYTVWASGGGDNSVKLFSVSASGVISVGNPASITIPPTQSSQTGFVSNYVPGSALGSNASGLPSGISKSTGAQTTFPAGSALSPDGKFLYVACNGDNSIAVINTATLALVREVPIGYFPYSVSVSTDGQTVAVSNWGITEYKFKKPTYDSTGKLIALGTTGQNAPDGYYVPVTNTLGALPKTSSISVLSAPSGNGAGLSLLKAKYFGHKLDSLVNVGDTHPSATAVVHSSVGDFLFVTKSNSDALGILSLAGAKSTKYPDFNLSPLTVSNVAPKVHGAYPNALAVSPDNTRLYVAEAGLNSVAVLDVTNPTAPSLLGRIPTDWYPTAVSVSSDGHYLYIANAKGVGEDINPAIVTPGTQTPPPSGLTSDSSTDSNYIFGSLQQVDLIRLSLDNTTVLANNFSLNNITDTSIVPLGGKASKKIKHVIFILHENKTFDSMLGNVASFGNFAGIAFNNRDGSTYSNRQFTGVSVNTQALASTFATAVNYYSDSEESDAGHQFAASGTASDYTEKTLLVKSGRGLLVNKNFEPEDYPEHGYIFNNAARHRVSFKDYGALVRIEGTDTGTSTPATLNDPNSGLAGLPALQADNFHVTNPLQNLGDTTTQVSGLGQSYFMSMPILSILGTNNASGEPRLDKNYPGYNFNISDQRRAQEFIQDFDCMVENGTLPTYIYLYQPNDHTGGIQASNSNIFTNTGLEEVADADVALGLVVQHIMRSPIYYEYDLNAGTAIFITYDDAQSSLDHIHPHRTPLLLVSPFAKSGYLATRHYVTASVVKTEELLMGLPPNNLGDLLATDLRDMFQPNYNGITASDITFAPKVNYKPSPEGKRIWSLVSKLDTSAPDRDSRRLGALTRLSAKADDLHESAEKQNRLDSPEYKKQQDSLFEEATRVVNSAVPRDGDDD
ncbi:MAG TPA: bifunctional YncE family protein/alkaline phosphatase family protein [Candidatus Sulfotelmatobacter sp.]